MKYKKIVVLTGAGVSAESGIETFRAADGLWENHPIDQVATPQGYARDPELVHRFYNQRRAGLKTVEPNPAHIALARLQEDMAAKGGTLTLVTQNVDDLHERGGAKDVIHMHGELRSMLCGACEHRWPHTEDASPEMACPDCDTEGAPRPDIVWFGEMPYHMDSIKRALADCALFVSIGTSGAVYPAAGFVQMARQMGKETLELNLEPSQGSHLFGQSRLGPASQLVPEWAQSVIAG